MTVGGKTLELDENGFLADPEEWNIDVASYIAAVEGIKMTEHHWEVVNFLRDYNGQCGTAPMIKVLIKELGQKLGPAKGNSKYLYELDPCGPATHACRIARLPEATGCV